MAAPPPPPARGGMSLYANLLDSTDKSASISREPVVFSEAAKEDAPAKKPIINTALQFQPIRRPQQKQNNRPKPGFPKAPPAIPSAAAATAPASTPLAAAAAAAAPATTTRITTTTTTTTTTTSTNTTTTTAAPAAPAQPSRSTLADWAAAEDDDYGYAEREKRQRGGRRKKKKKKGGEQRQETDWDEIYDPARPTNVEEYLRSEERIREIQEWKAVLYAHRRRSREKSYSDDEEDRPRMGLGNQFAPPPSMNFAPPASLSFAPPPVSPPPAATVSDLTGDEAYARRLALSQSQPPPPPPPPPSPPPPAASDGTTVSISRAPVRYSPPPPTDQEKGDDDAMSIDSQTDYSSIPLPSQSSSAPQAGPSKTRGREFAKKLMTKYGWTAGAGLGASGSGITTALRVETIKRKKRPDSEGGGFAEPGGRGRIIAPKKSAAAQPKSKDGGDDKSGGGGGGGDGGAGFGKISEVIVLRNMLENMENLEDEIEKGLGQEIGEECGESYGRVERVKIDVDGEGRKVFIKFVEGVSALRAVNALNGRVFNGNVIEARFFDAERFERGEYE